MQKNKFFLLSLIFVLFTSIAILLLGSFIFGVKVGVKRQNPYFEKVIELYNFSQRFDNIFEIIFDKTYSQKVKQKKQNKI